MSAKNHSVVTKSSRQLRQRVIFELLFLSLVLATIIFCLSLLFRDAGWPLNNDGVNFGTRAQIYAAHIARGDWFPIWSSSDAHGFGTPMPLYYQRVFYYIAGFLLLVGVQIKLAIVMTLAFFLGVGAYGMRFATGLITKNKWLITAAPLALLLSNYTFAEWLVGGVMAELTAAMIVTWLIWWSIRLVKNHVFSYWIIPITITLFYAHNAITLVAILVPFVAVILYIHSLVKQKLFTRRLFIKPLISLGVICLFIVPLLILEVLFNQTFDPAGKITQGGLSVFEHFRSVSEYLFGTGQAWLETWGRFPVHLDYSLTIPLIGLVVAIIAFTLRKKRNIFLAEVSKTAKTPIGRLLIISTLVYLTLQLSITAPVYYILKPLQYTQFAWRMLAVATPLMILVVMLFADRISTFWKHPKRMKMLVIIWISLFVILSPVFSLFNFGFISSAKTNTRIQYNDQVGFMERGEYLPKVYNKTTGVQLTSDQVAHIYDKIMRGDPPISMNGVPCRTSTVRSTFESLERTYTITCDKATTIALPLTYTPYTRVSTGNQTIKTFQNKTDPRLMISLPAGKITIHVAEPTVGRVLGLN